MLQIMEVGKCKGSERFAEPPVSVIRCTIQKDVIQNNKKRKRGNKHRAYSAPSESTSPENQMLSCDMLASCINAMHVDGRIMHELCM